MSTEERQINWDAFYLLGGAVVVAILITVSGCLVGSHLVYDHGGLDNGTGIEFGHYEKYSVSLYSIIAIVVAWAMACSSIAGLFRNTRAQRDGLFSAEFILHIIVCILGYMGASMTSGHGGIPNLVLLIIAIIIAIVFDSCYEGIGNTKDNRGENPIEADQKEIDKY